MTNPLPLRLSVIVPAYNEEFRLPETLRQMIRFLEAQSYRSEILVVDDGSTDDTARVVQNSPPAAIPIRLITHPDKSNHGKGASVRVGMLEAHGEYRLFMDADNSTTLDQVERFWPFFEQGFDLILGSRSIEGARVAVHQSRFKEIAGRAGNRFIQSLAVPGISDTQAGFKMFTRRCADAVFPRLTIERWGFDIEVLVIARTMGFRMREIPITWVNSSGSKVGFATYFEVLKDVLQIRRNQHSGIYNR